MISKWLVHAYACGKVHPQVGLTLKLITDGYSACKLQHIGPYVVKDRSPVSLNIDYLGRRLMHAAAGDLQDTTLCIFRSKVSKEVRRRNTFHAIVHRITAISGSLYRCRRNIVLTPTCHADSFISVRQDVFLGSIATLLYKGPPRCSSPGNW